MTRAYRFDRLVHGTAPVCVAAAALGIACRTFAPSLAAKESIGRSHEGSGRGHFCRRPDLRQKAAETNRGELRSLCYLLVRSPPEGFAPKKGTVPLPIVPDGGDARDGKGTVPSLGQRRLTPTSRTASH